MQSRTLLIRAFFEENIPSLFFDSFDLPGWGLDSEEFIQIENPKNSEYWSTWKKALEKALYLDTLGKYWRLEQDGRELFAIECNSIGERL